MRDRELSSLVTSMYAVAVRGLSKTSTMSYTRKDRLRTRQCYQYTAAGILDDVCKSAVHSMMRLM